MNSNINLDINSYLSEELEKLVGLKESYDRNNLFDFSLTLQQVVD